jgi:hypothetical protein
MVRQFLSAAPGMLGAKLVAAEDELASKTVIDTRLGKDPRITAVSEVLDDQGFFPTDP